MKTMLKWFLMILGLASTVTTEACASDQPRENPQERAKHIWRKILAASADDPDEYKQHLADYWGDIHAKCADAFEELEGDPDYAQMVRYFVNQFGKYGAQADMRWLIADVRMTLPTTSVRAGYFRHPVRGPVQREVCRALVCRFLQDPQLLRRYYVATLWSGLFVRPEEKLPSGYRRQAFSFELVVLHACKGLAEAPPSEYWWYARNFLLVVHATGRDDLLKGADPTNLKKESAEFRRWFAQNKSYLRVDANYPRWILDEKAKEKGDALLKDSYLPYIARPSQPFAHWTGPPPPPPWTMSSF